MSRALANPSFPHCLFQPPSLPPAQPQIANGSYVSLAPPTTVIRVYIHAISPDGVANFVADEAIEAQMATLNASYAPWGIGFALAAPVNRVVSGVWVNLAEGRVEQQMKRQLRRGTAQDLNIYITSLTGDMYGWATFPEDYNAWPNDDGVVILFDSLPGLSGDPYSDQGGTAVHEIGHWLVRCFAFVCACALQIQTTGRTTHIHTS